MTKEIEPTPEVPASTARDLLALRDSVVDAASIGGGLWFSYIFVLLYLLIAVGSVTHRDLFLESPVKLPFFQVDLPLLGFFWLGPLIFLIVHAYVLLHFVLLAGKAGDFDAELKAQIADDDTRMRLRRQLPSNIFVQFLAGSREVRTGLIGFMLRLIAQISLVIGPIALLVFFELQFLPYHHEAITWWHRIAVLADIVILWMLWPSIVRGERSWLSRADLRRVKIRIFGAVSLVPILLVFTIATFPGEWLEDTLPPLQIVPWNGETFDLEKGEMVRSWRLTSLHELLVAGEVDFAARKPESLWSNRLVLPGFDAIDHTKFDSEAKIEAASETVSLRARHLEGAVLIGAELRKADFTGAQLQHAWLMNSDLREAKFGCPEVRRGAAHECGQLRGALLNSAKLEGASLDNASLERTLLDYADLQGATLNGADLRRASLIGARLQGASLDFAHLQGASLDSAQLQCASVNLANLQAAILNKANLQGASLDQAQLLGVTLFDAQLQGASFRNVFSWRADARQAIWEDARVLNPQFDPMSLDLFEKLKQQFSDGAVRHATMRLIENLDPSKALEGEDEMTKVWQDQARASPAVEAFEKRLARTWREIGCAAQGAPYVLRRLLLRLENTSATFYEKSPHPAALAAAFLDEEHCPGARGLTDSEKARLKEIRDRSPSPVSKQ